MRAILKVRSHAQRLEATKRPEAIRFLDERWRLERQTRRGRVQQHEKVDKFHFMRIWSDSVERLPMGEDGKAHVIRRAACESAGCFVLAAKIWVIVKSGTFVAPHDDKCFYGNQ